MDVEERVERIIDVIAISTNPALTIPEGTVEEVLEAIGDEQGLKTYLERKSNSPQ